MSMNPTHQIVVFGPVVFHMPPHEKRKENENVSHEE